MSRIALSCFKPQQEIASVRFVLLVGNTLSTSVLSGLERAGHKGQLIFGNNHLPYSFKSSVKHFKSLSLYREQEVTNVQFDRFEYLHSQITIYPSSVGKFLASGVYMKMSFVCVNGGKIFPTSAITVAPY